MKEERKKEEKKAKIKAERAPYKASILQRLVNVILGLGFIGLSLWALSYESTSLKTAVMIFGGILALSGLIRVINAFYEEEIGGTARLLRFGFASLLIVAAVYVFLFPSTGDKVLYVILGIALIFQGLGRMVRGISIGAFPGWLKLTQILMGIASVVVGVAAMLPSLIDLNYSFSTIILLVIGFFISGLSRVTLALVGLSDKKKEEKSSL